MVNLNIQYIRKSEQSLHKRNSEKTWNIIEHILLLKIP